MAKKIKIPMRFLRIAPQGQGKTIAIRGKGGRFIGRRGPDSVPSYKGSGDTTKARYLFKSFDFNQNKKIDPFERGGTIHGRTEKKISVRASRRARGYERRV